MNKIFIGSSGKALKIADAIQTKLTSLLPDFQITIWSQNVFIVSRTFIETLMKASREEYDFAIFIFAPDDVTIFNQEHFFNTRDNVIFEYGLFTGTLNKDRVFAFTPSDVSNFRIPSDILGVKTAQYEFKSITEENILDIVHRPCLQVKYAIENVKPSYRNTIIGSYTTPREHYRIANKILSSKDISELILVQKSSSLILGHERGDKDEEVFSNNIFNYISDGNKFYHITDVAKIEEKISNDRTFINSKREEIKNIYSNNKTLPIRLPDKETPQPILLVKYNHHKKPMEGIILSHTGISEACLHVRGKMIKKYWDTYLECYYNRCTELGNSQLIKLIDNVR